MRRILFIVAMLAVIGFCVDARRVKSTRRGLHELSCGTEVVDTVTNSLIKIVLPGDSDIVVSGFDKPLQSLNESMFITNNLDSTVTHLYVTLDYHDRTGRQLHKRSVPIEVKIPPKSTRQVTLRSWDRQKSFYYILGRRPYTLATGFSVECRVDSVEVDLRASD